MKLAILLTGNIRTWDQTKKSFLDNFSHLRPDVYVCTYEQRYGYHPHIKGVINDHEDYIMSHEEISNHFNSVAKVIRLCTPIDDTIRAQVHHDFRDSDNTVGQVLRLNECIDLMLEHSNTTYDVVIKSRCDLLYEPVDFNIDLNSNVLIDSGNVFPNDCFYATTQANMINIARFMANEIVAPQYNDSHLQAPHQLLHNAVVGSGLSFTQQKIISGVLRKGNKVQTY